MCLFVWGICCVICLSLRCVFMFNYVYRSGGFWVYSLCGLCKDMGRRCGGRMYYEVAVERVNI